MYITMLGHIASSVAYYCWNITHVDILFKANFIKTYVGHVTNHMDVRKNIIKTEIATFRL